MSTSVVDFLQLTKQWSPIQFDIELNRSVCVCLVEAHFPDRPNNTRFQGNLEAQDVIKWRYPHDINHTIEQQFPHSFNLILVQEKISIAFLLQIRNKHILIGDISETPRLLKLLCHDCFHERSFPLELNPFCAVTKRFQQNLPGCISPIQKGSQSMQKERPRKTLQPITSLFSVA